MNHMLSERHPIGKIYMAIAILTSGYALTTTHYSPAIYLLCAAGIGIFLVLTLTGSRRVEIRKLQAAFLLLSALLLPSVAGLLANATTPNIVSFVKFALSLLFGAVLFLSFDFKTLRNLFSSFMLAICTASLIGYVLINFTEVLASLPVITNVNDVGYKFAFFFISFDGFLQYRNIGIFWEPGIFATMIFCALVADLYAEKETSGLRTGIFLTTLASTFSGAGIILLFFYTTLVFSQPLKNHNKVFPKRIAPVIATVLIFCIDGLYIADSQPNAAIYLDRLAGKLTTPGETQSTRMISPLASLQVFSEKPIMGWGFASAIEEYRKINDEISLTSTSTYLMAAIGISGLLFSLIPIIGIAKQGSLNLITRGLLICSFLFVINKEPHMYFTLTHSVLFFSMLSRQRKHCNRGRIIKPASEPQRKRENRLLAHQPGV